MIEPCEEKPLFSPIKNGWAARGKGWAVHGVSQEEALQKFREAEQKHREIDARPCNPERKEVLNNGPTQ
jgi:hypothetical protein